MCDQEDDRLALVLSWFRDPASAFGKLRGGTRHTNVQGVLVEVYPALGAWPAHVRRMHNVSKGPEGVGENTFVIGEQKRGSRSNDKKTPRLAWLGNGSVGPPRAKLTDLGREHGFQRRQTSTGTQLRFRSKASFCLDVF